jgi:hypothetical protein
VDRVRELVREQLRGAGRQLAAVAPRNRAAPVRRRPDEVMLRPRLHRLRVALDEAEKAAAGAAH